MIDKYNEQEQAKAVAVEGARGLASGLTTVAAAAPVERSAREILTSRLRHQQDELVLRLSNLRDAERMVQGASEHALRDALRLIDTLAMSRIY